MLQLCSKRGIAKQIKKHLFSNTENKCFLFSL
jgi:hypothetical protein